jgi:hypothetical protein
MAKSHRREQEGAASRRWPRPGAAPRLVGAAVLAALLAACGDGGSNGSVGPGLDVSGTYEGMLSFASPPGAGQVSVRFSFVQVGNLINGTFSNGNQDAGSFVGSASGTVFSGTATSTISRIRCDFEGAIQNRGATIAGTFECSSGEAGAFSVSRV